MAIKTDHMIELHPDCDIRAFVSDCYEMSRPLGVGRLHFEPEPLQTDTIDDILDGNAPYGRVMAETVARMDYVHGRAVKMNVYSEGASYWILSDWYDHSEKDLMELCARHAKDAEHYRAQLESHVSESGADLSEVAAMIDLLIMQDGYDPNSARICAARTSTGAPCQNLVDGGTTKCAAGHPVASSMR